MKFRLTFKTPDVLDDAIEEHLDDMQISSDILRDELEYEIRQFVEPYIKYGEYVTLVFDTETNTVSVAKK